MLLRGKDQVLAHGEFGKDLQQLERAADAELVEIARPHAGHRATIEMYLAAGRPKLPEDAVEQRGLATAVRPDNAEDLALVHLERHALDCMNAAETLRDTADFEHRAHAAGRAVNRFARNPMIPLGLRMSSTITNAAYKKR